ncbi:MAG: DinB family protein [Ktedonobacteraceae bacterium]
MTKEEIAQLRSYLASQSMKRTPTQIYDTLREVYHQFLEALGQFSEAAFEKSYQDGAWSIAEILEHVTLFMAVYEQAICTALEQGLCPPDVNDRNEILPRHRQMSRLELLSILESSFQRLEHTVHQVEPDSQLELTWKHFELGAMHWREWLLFARIHLLDHLRQLQTMQL